MSKEEDLLRRIQDLEAELRRKDLDLKIYKKELTEANTELERLIVQVNDQLQQSLKIQKFLVPTEFPNIPGFEFSTKFSSSSMSGGDYFDIFEHSNKMRFGLFLSSASGYGMSALFLSVLMKMTYEIEELRSRDPGLVMGEILQELRTQSQAKDQAAIFYGVFDRRKFQMTYCNIGQTLALHYKSADQRLELLQSSPKGFTMQAQASDFELTNSVVDLNPNDKLIFCSTGFLAMQNESGRLWGIDEVLSVVNQNVKKDVHELRNEIFYQALKFGKVQPRDLTVIVTEVKERVIKLASELN